MTTGFIVFLILTAPLWLGLAFVVGGTALALFVGMWAGFFSLVRSIWNGTLPSSPRSRK